MGRFIYGNQRTKIDIDDRALVHLQHVIGNKLRRGESFYFSWKEDASVGGGRRTIWIHQNADLEFQYHGSRVAPINRDWLEALNAVASSATGLYVIPEPAQTSRSAPQPLVG